MLGELLATLTSVFSESIPFLAQDMQSLQILGCWCPQRDGYSGITISLGGSKLKFSYHECVHSECLPLMISTRAIGQYKMLNNFLEWTLKDMGFNLHYMRKYTYLSSKQLQKRPVAKIEWLCGTFRLSHFVAEHRQAEVVPMLQLRLGKDRVCQIW